MQWDKPITKISHFLFNMSTPSRHSPHVHTSHISHTTRSMGLLPDTQICGCACAGNAGNVFPVTAGKRSQHASRHVRHPRAVMHAGIANQRFPLKSAAGENVPSIPGACATCNFTYLVRGPWRIPHLRKPEDTHPKHTNKDSSLKVNKKLKTSKHFRIYFTKIWLVTTKLRSMVLQ